MTKQEIIDNFDPNQPGLADASLFGLPFSAEQSEIIIIPVPWEVTVSYGAGASKGVKAVFNASFQVDLQHQEFPELWKNGIFMDDEIPDWNERSEKYKKLALTIIEALENGETIDQNQSIDKNLEEINQASLLLKNELKERVLHWKSQNKIIGLLG